MRRPYLWIFCVDGRILLKLKVKELVQIVLTGSVWTWMLVAGRLYNSVVERMFFVSGECLDQLMHSDTVTQYFRALYCVCVWQAMQTWQCSVQGSVLLCCCNMITGKLILLYWRMQAIDLLKISVTINKLTYHISPQRWTLSNTTTVRTCNLA